LADIPLYFWFSDTHGNGSASKSTHAVHPFNVVASYYSTNALVSTEDSGKGIPNYFGRPRGWLELRVVSQ